MSREMSPCSFIFMNIYEMLALLEQAFLFCEKVKLVNQNSFDKLYINLLFYVTSKVCIVNENIYRRNKIATVKALITYTFPKSKFNNFKKSVFLTNISRSEFKCR